jgi:hypothetical protein
VRQASRVNRVKLVSRATRELKAQQVILVPRALVEWQAKMAQQGQEGWKENRVKLE